MVASIWLRAAHRGMPTFLVTALVLGQSPMALAESPAQRGAQPDRSHHRAIPV